jgi:CDP-diacylglycerol--serine O-phosphatidyltransferase
MIDKNFLLRKKFLFAKKKKKHISISSLLPNAITLTAICCGITSLRFALMEKWELAVLSIFFAAFFDVIDGAVARMLKVTSEFGAQLDSLSDLTSFGIAPGFIMYLWILKNHGLFGWIGVIFYILCIVIRLARFNVTALSPIIKKYEWKKMFFQGAPSPAAGALLMLPLIIELSEIPIRHNIYSSPYIILYTIVIGVLAVSKIPTFSVKKIYIPKKYLSLIMVGLGCATILLINYPWKIIPFLLICYLLSIPISIYKYTKFKRLSESN